MLTSKVRITPLMRPIWTRLNELSFHLDWQLESDCFSRWSTTHRGTYYDLRVWMSYANGVWLSQINIIKQLSHFERVEHFKTYDAVRDDIEWIQPALYWAEERIQTPLDYMFDALKGNSNGDER